MDRQARELAEGIHRQLAASRARSILTVGRVISGLGEVIEANERLAQDPAHRTQARRRIGEAQVELARATHELAVLQGDVQGPDSSELPSDT
jgi:hypothetical protein